MTRLLEFVRSLYVVRDREGFISHLLRALPVLIPADVASFNEADPVTHRSQTWMNPRDPLTSENIRTWNALMHEHPYVALQTRSPHPRPVVRVSELARRSEFARTAVYNELLYPLGLDEQLLMAFPSRRMPVGGAGLYRHRRDFSEEERFAVSLLHPHLLQAYDNAERITKVLDDLAALERGVDELQRGLVCLTPEGTVRRPTALARTWLRAYFPRRSTGTERLPDALHRWVVEHLRRLNAPEDMTSPVRAFIVEGKGRRLVIRLVPDRSAPLLLLHEEGVELATKPLQSLGLSRREAEVLAWVAEGKTNPETALILGLSPRTVQTYLDRIFRRLGVETRTAAAAAAFAVMMQPG
jgi:DNA-binding CsgD family transcriptional regulator